MRDRDEQDVKKKMNEPGREGRTGEQTPGKDWGSGSGAGSPSKEGTPGRSGGGMKDEPDRDE